MPSDTHPKPRFACAACLGPVEETCPCGRITGAWAYAEEVIMLGRPPGQAEDTHALAAAI